MKFSKNTQIMAYSYAVTNYQVYKAPDLKAEIITLFYIIIVYYPITTDMF
jgi:hypothetical protein